MSRWGDTKTLNFILHYREYECLWNTGSPLYKNRTARENAYEQLLVLLNDSNVSVKMIKTKIKNLRSVYHHELKKIKDSMRSGADAAQIYKPSLSWFEEMHSFLGDTVEYRKKIGTGIASETSSMKTSQPEIHDNSKPISNTISQSDVVPEAAPGASERFATSEQSSGLAPQILLRRRKKRYDNTLFSNTLERLQNISTTINTPRSNEDEFYYFALSVAAQLRKLPLRTALHLQSEIQHLLSMARCSEECNEAEAYKSPPNSSHCIEEASVSAGTSVSHSAMLSPSNTTALISSEQTSTDTSEDSSC